MDLEKSYQAIGPDPDLEKWYEDIVYSIAEQIELDRQNRKTDPLRSELFSAKSEM